MCRVGWPRWVRKGKGRRGEGGGKGGREKEGEKGRRREEEEKGGGGERRGERGGEGGGEEGEKEIVGMMGDGGVWGRGICAYLGRPSGKVACKDTQ